MRKMTSVKEEKEKKRCAMMSKSEGGDVEAYKIRPGACTALGIGEAVLGGSLSEGLVKRRVL